MVAGSGKLHQGTWGFFIRKGHVPSFWHCNSLKTQSFYLKNPLQVSLLSLCVQPTAGYFSGYPTPARYYLSGTMASGITVSAH